MAENIRTNTVRKSILDAATVALDLTAVMNISDPDGPNGTMRHTRSIVIRTLLMIASDLDIDIRNVLMEVHRNIYRSTDDELTELLSAAKKNPADSR